MSNVQVIAKANVLGAPVNTAFVKKETEKEINDGNTPIKCTLSENIMLVHGHPEKPVLKTLDALIKELTSLISLGKLDKNKLLDVLPDGVKTALENIEFSVNEIYFLKKTASLKAPDSTQQDKINKQLEKNTNGTYKTDNSNAAKLISETEKSSEYALWIDVNVNPSLMKDFPIQVSSLSFKIWDTENKEILEEMEITKIQKMLAGAGVNGTKEIKDDSGE
jgi:hypothetical protein